MNQKYYYVTSQGPTEDGPLLVIGTDSKRHAHSFADGYAKFHPQHKVWVVEMVHETIRDDYVGGQLCIQDPTIERGATNGAV